MTGTKASYLGELKKQLTRLKINDVDDVIFDYEQHFEAGIERGKSESELCAELGSPKNIALQYVADRSDGPGKSTYDFSAILSTLGILVMVAPFNFLVVVIPLFFFGLYLVVSFSLPLPIISALGELGYAYLTTQSTMVLDWTTHVASWSFGMGLLFACILLLCVNIYLIRLIYRLLKRYIIWNIKLISVENKL